MHNQVLQFIFPSIPSPKNPRNLFKENLNVCRKSLSFDRTLIPKCQKNPEEKKWTGDLKESLVGLVGEQVEELLSREENKGLLDGLEKASMRVEMAKRELAEIKKRELEAKMLKDYVNQLQDRASEIAECQQEISEARVMVEQAVRSLSLSAAEVGDRDLDENTTNGDTIDKGKERWESVKAALVSAIIGTLAELPISLSQVSQADQLILPLGITFISCALFGVTFRYTIRRDLDNVQLKTGTCAAFSFVKGLGTLSAGQPLELTLESFVSHAFDGVAFVSQSLLIFTFAAVGLDLCFKTTFLSPFPMKRSASDANTTKTFSK